jgi:hypothetical protein
VAGVRCCGAWAQIYGAVGLSLYKWTELAKACLKRYRSNACCLSVKKLSTRSKLWRLGEASLATPYGDPQDATGAQ